MNGIIEEWLSEYKNEKTKRTTSQRFTKFLEWSKKTPEQLKELDPKEAKHQILQFQKAMVEQNIKNNTILSYISASKLFFEYCGIPLSFRRGQLVNPQKAMGYHAFSNGDLGKMFEVANPQYKALIAMASSCGFSINDILRQSKEKIKAEIVRARAEGRNFIFIEEIRQKTNSEALLVLNPLAITWLEKWIDQNPKPTLFNVRDAAIGLMLNQLAKRSGITLTGKIRFHNIRKWVMSSLSKSGFNEFQIKHIIGKKIPLSDATYLLTLKEEIEEKYPEIYAKYLNILPEGAIVKSKDKEIKELVKENEAIRNVLISLIGKDKIQRLVGKLAKPKYFAEDSMFPDFKRKDIEELSNKELLDLYAQILKEGGRA